MRRNLERTRGLIFSQSVLLALTNAGMKREEAYRIVQSSAMEVWKSGREFQEMLAQDPAVTAVLSPAQLDTLFDLGRSIRNVDHIFERVGLGG
jgi:adenylosuccinate lyase